MKDKLLFLCFILILAGSQAQCQTIQEDIPIATQVPLTATATAEAGIKSIQWKQLSGPATPLIVNPNNLNTLVTGFDTPGIYVYGITVTDNVNQMWSDQVEIEVLKWWNGPVGKAEAGYKKFRLPVPDKK